MASIVLAKKKVFSRPRSISGCLTCKYRRVKCDETKPKCHRCIKFKTECDGYETRPTKVNQKTARGPPRLIPILPHSTDRSQPWYLQPSQDFSFQSELEAFYFLNFRDCVVPELAGPLGSSLWSRIILQACHFECYVREAVVALAALRMSLSTVHKSTMPPSSIEISAQHSRFALQQYGKAVRNMRKALVVSNTESSRKALICCLLIFCFEVFQGNHELAILHAKSGYQLLQEWLVTKSFNSSSARGISYAGHTSIEDDIVRAFNRLDLQIMTYTNSNSLEVHKFASQDRSSMVAHMPQLFSDLDEANRYWELVMMRNHHFIHSVIATAEVNTNKHSSTNVATKTNFRAGIGSLIRSFSHSNRFPILQAEHSLYSAEITRWQSAFRPFLSSTNGRIHAGAAILQMHSISTQITLDLLIANEDAVNEYTDKFQEILYLARSSVLGPVKESFSMDLGIIPSLYVVLGNCRDPVLQHEALHILASMVRREGLWNSLDIQINDKHLP